MKLLLIILSVLAPIVTILSFTGHMSNIIGFIIKLVSQSYRYQKKIFQNILIWYKYIDTNLDTTDFQKSYLDAIEREIDHMFSAKYKNRVILQFNRRFRRKILKMFGVKKEFQNDEYFLRYARLNYPNVELIVQLSSLVSKKKYSVFKLKFKDYWNVMRGNFYNFLGQYNTSWENVKNGDRKFTIADVEMPVKILRYYFDM